MSKVIETAAINTPLRNLLNFQKRSVGEELVIASNEHILLTKYSIKSLVSKLINGDFGLINKKEIGDYVSHFIVPFADELRGHFNVDFFLEGYQRCYE